MTKYKKAFKTECTNCIWKMINNENISYSAFFKHAESIELLWNSYLKKLEISSNLLSYTCLYKEYISRLNAVYKKSIKS